MAAILMYTTHSKNTINTAAAAISVSCEVTFLTASRFAAESFPIKINNGIVESISTKSAGIILTSTPLPISLLEAGGY
ncbi:hypothetical protein [Ruminococcus bicirculans (ex Wegman et al. 2014)]|uniref:hypothetical protein n=1 Tax=Ruminococcus TaxID=1263 RepID=UPI00242FD3D8|nr:hypothetical protein [Ruminococcus bicirculans (ex Wegman et al. 2014)]